MALNCTSTYEYAHCTLARHHGGACEGSGYRWLRGRGYARKHLLTTPRECSDTTCGICVRCQTPHRLTFGIDRLRKSERTCLAWPTLAQVEGRRATAYTRWVSGAKSDPQYLALLGAHPYVEQPGEIGNPAWSPPDA